MMRELSLNEILTIIRENKTGFIDFSRYPLEDYEGMYEEYSLIYDYDSKNYKLMHSFICYILDFFGDDSQDIEYEFSNVEEIIKYIENKLNKKLKDITLLDREKIPTLFDITEDERKKIEKNWQKCREDFKKGKFLDKDLKLIN
ncbi:MAG: hypothetical protein U0354_09485 [Candidatus Sericytochromatia bacterium]